MNIMIPMAGEGQRFKDAGYQIHKPVVETTNYRNGKKMPMVVCATMDLPQVKADGSNVIYIDRDFHKAEGVEERIKDYFPKAQFVTLDKLTEGQACTCLKAECYLKQDEELLIAGCDNGMVIDEKEFVKQKRECDAMIFVYRHNPAVCENPSAYGWAITRENNELEKMSIKVPVSDNPMEDFAVVATFWFKRGDIFTKAAKKMIEENDRINGEFYVDEVMTHVKDMGYCVKVFEVERYIGWGTPKDYENYEKTLQYWKYFVKNNEFLGV